MTDIYRYKAFISYSHADKAAADRLLQDLENYRVPKRLAGKPGQNGTRMPKRIGRIFRDRDELPAAEDLTAEVKKALTQSEFMIVLCSPAAAASRWVNREIIEFKKLTGERRILSVILSGEPFASNQGAPEQECFPPALRFKLGKNGQLTKTPSEPLAADLRPDGDGRRRGKLKLIAGLLEIGLDTLIERDLQRKMRRVMAVTAASVVAMLGMGLLTYEAVDARREAEHHRGEAEELIEFMLTDLREKLEPVGRLDVLDAVGEKAISYYDGQVLNDMSGDALGRRARAFHLLGEIDDKQGDLLGAREKFEAAYQTTAAQLAHDPNNPNRIFDHSQSAFWLATFQRRTMAFEETLSSIEEYASLSEQLISIDNRPEWLMEAGHAASNKGTLFLRHLNMPLKAKVNIERSLALFEQASQKNPQKPQYRYQVSDAHAWLADTLSVLGDLSGSRKHREKQIGILVRLRAKQPDNKRYLRGVAGAYFGVGRLEKLFGDWRAAESNFRMATAAFEDLKDTDTENFRWHKMAAVANIFWADALIETHDIQSAESRLLIAKHHEAKLIENNLDSEQIRLETVVWRGITEAKLFVAKGQFSAAQTRVTEAIRHLGILPENGKTQMLDIPLKQEASAVLEAVKTNLVIKAKEK